MSSGLFSLPTASCCVAARRLAVIGSGKEIVQINNKHIMRCHLSLGCTEGRFGQNQRRFSMTRGVRAGKRIYAASIQYTTKPLSSVLVPLTPRQSPSREFTKKITYIQCNYANNPDWDSKKCGTSCDCLCRQKSPISNVKTIAFSASIHDSSHNLCPSVRLSTSIHPFVQR